MGMAHGLRFTDLPSGVRNPGLRKVNGIVKISLAGAFALCGCGGTVPPPAKDGLPPVAKREMPSKAVQAPEHADTETSREDSGLCWAPLHRPDIKGILIVITKEVTFGELARQLGTNVDHLNAVNELQLKPETLIAVSSELYISRDSPLI